jgi:putative copper resistance protein D
MTHAGLAPSATQVLTTWRWSPVADVLIALAVSAYLGAAGRYHDRRRARWPAGRTACWVAGALLTLACVSSALSVYGRNLLSVHMIVHLTLITVVPALAVWAQPIRLLYDVSNARTRRVMQRLGRSRVWRWSITPWFTVPAYVVVLVGTHLTGFQELMLHHMWLHHLELGVYALSGYLLLLPIVGDELTGLTIAPILRFVILALCMAPDTLVGVVLMLTRMPSAPAYSAARDWGPTALADQSIAGAIMWWGGDGLMMILMLVVAANWVRATPADGGGLGPWLDRVRRQTVLGTETGDNIDDDDAALAAYNARLAALHGITPRRQQNRRD